MNNMLKKATVILYNYYKNFTIQGGMLMIKGIGTDIIEIQRISSASEGFFKRIFTNKEMQYFHGRNYEVLAGSFAVKEAVAKALGTGFRGFSPKDIEVLRDDLGKPYVILYENARSLFEQLNGTAVFVSISHNKSNAVGFAVIE